MGMSCFCTGHELGGHRRVIVSFLSSAPPKWLRVSFWFPVKTTKQSGTLKKRHPFRWGFMYEFGGASLLQFMCKWFVLKYDMGVPQNGPILCHFQVPNKRALEKDTQSRPTMKHRGKFRSLVFGMEGNGLPPN